jgi:hypothetical protein
MSEETIQVHVDTKDLKDDGNGLYEIKVGLVGIKSFKLHTLEIPMLNYYISGYNNVIRFKEGNAGNPILTVTIPPGNYLMTTLINKIEELMNLAGSGYALFYNSVSGKIYITKSNGVFSILLSGTTAAKVIGLSADTAFAANTYMQNVYNLLPFNYVFLQSTELMQLKARKNIFYGHPGITNIIHKIPVVAKFGDTNIVTVISDKRNYLKQAINIDKFTFKMVDPNGNRVQFGGIPYTFTINFYR